MKKGAKMILVCYAILTITHLFGLTAYGALCWAHVNEERSEKPGQAVFVSKPTEGGN